MLMIPFVRRTRRQDSPPPSPTRCLRELQRARERVDEDVPRQQREDHGTSKVAFSRPNLDSNAVPAGFEQHVTKVLFSALLAPETVSE